MQSQSRSLQDVQSIGRIDDLQNHCKDNNKDNAEYKPLSIAHNQLLLLTKIIQELLPLYHTTKLVSNKPYL